MDTKQADALVFFGALVASRISDRVTSGQALALGGLLALGCVLATGSLRSRYGVALGWLMQALVLATGVVVPAMFAMGVLFAALWVGALRVGKMVATAGEGSVSSR